MIWTDDIYYGLDLILKFQYVHISLNINIDPHFFWRKHTFYSYQGAFVINIIGFLTTADC